MPDRPSSPPYTEATGPQAEAKPSKPSDLVAQKITDHAPGCDCSSCWGIRTGFDIGYASAMAAGVAAGRAQAAADIRTEAERWDRLGYDDEGAWIAAIRAAEGGGEADQSKEHR